MCHVFAEAEGCREYFSARSLEAAVGIDLKYGFCKGGRGGI